MEGTGPVATFKDLMVWQESFQLAIDCYKLTETMPKDETFGLRSQIRRAASSVPANIAEGAGRRHTLDYLRSIGIANGSLWELESHLLLAKALNLLVDIQACEARCESIRKMLYRLEQALERKAERKVQASK